MLSKESNVINVLNGPYFQHELANVAPNKLNKLKGLNIIRHIVKLKLLFEEIYGCFNVT